MPNEFRKKPVVVEAEQFTEERAISCLIDRQPGPFGLIASGDYHPENRTISRAWLSIKTLEGAMRADIGDWIIRGVKGELYPCKPDIFADTYEPAASPSDAERHESAVPDGRYNIEAIAKVISLSYGEDPEEDAPLGKICGPNNEPLPCWMAYEEQAEAVFTWMMAVINHLSPPAAVQEPEAVKELEWNNNHAQSLGLEYNVWWYAMGSRWLARNGTRGIGDGYSSADEAKVAAQADYEQRIRSALSTSQSDPAPEIAEYSKPRNGDRGGGRSENNEGDTLEGVIASNDHKGAADV